MGALRGPKVSRSMLKRPIIADPCNVSQMAGLKDMMHVQEIVFTLASATRDVARYRHQHLEAECQKLRSAYGGESYSILHYVSVPPSYLVMNQLLLYRVAHKDTLGLGGEGSCELEVARDGHPASSANLLRIGSLQRHARCWSRECLAFASS